MKTTNMLLSFLIFSLVTSCSTIESKNSKLKAKVKAQSPVNLNAKSAPVNGYNYYNLPEAPKMQKKQQTSKNVKPTKKSSIKK